MIAEIEELEAQLVSGYTVKDNFMEIFMEVGTGNAKLAYSTYMEGSKTWLKVSMAACSSVEIDAYTSIEYSFILSVAYSDDDSDPKLNPIPIISLLKFIEFASMPTSPRARVAYLIPNRGIASSFCTDSSVDPKSAFATVIGVITIILELLGIVLLI